MGTLTSQKAQDRLLVGYALDRLWSETMGLPEGDSKEQPLRLVAQLLERESVPYALIGGVAVQVYSEEPRSTLDIDLAVPTYDRVPRVALLGAGFEHTGSHEHSDNWRAPGSGPLMPRAAVQFSAEDEGIAEAVENAVTVDLPGGIRLRVATVASLIALKLAAAEETQRRPSKREHDVADVLALIEEHPEADSPALRNRLHRIRTVILGGAIDGEAPAGSK